MRARLHGATIRGRLRSDPGLLVLVGLVVALTAALVTAVGPLTDRTADRAIAATVRDAGPRGSVTATMPEQYQDPRSRTRDPSTATQVAQATTYAETVLPDDLAAVLRPGVASLTTPALHLLDAGPGRYLRLAYVDTPAGPPAVTYTSGGPPEASVGPGRADVTLPGDAGPWPVQVALSEEAARLLDLAPGDRISAEDEQARPFRIRISGVYRAVDPTDDGWRVASELLQPTQGVSEGVERTSAAALVSAEALPDLRLAVPSDELRHRVAFTPRPEALGWRAVPDLQRSVVSLEASAGMARSGITWDSLLDEVLGDGRGQVDSARGQAQVLLVGLLAGALLVLVLASQLLVRRRSGPVVVARERGASLLGLGLELLVESLGVAVLGTALGVGATWLLVGDADPLAAVVPLVVAAAAAPVLGVVAAKRATAARRAPANRSARRALARGRQVLRLAVEGAVLAAAVFAVVALRERGVVGGDLAAASAVTWVVVAACLLLLRLLPLGVRLVLRATRRSVGEVGFLAAARLGETGARALPLLVVVVAVAQLTVGVALAATEREGQAAGALLAVGGDARLRTPPDPALEGVAADVASAPGVRAVAAGRVADGVRASSSGTAASVRLVVVDAPAYARLLAAGDLPDAPDLAALASPGPRVPALLLGGDPALRDDLVVHWDDANVPLTLVGEAPRVEASVDPVVVVDAAAFAGAGAVVQPDTVWAVGPGAAAALGGSAGDLLTYDDELAARRDAPLAAGLARLAVATAALLLLLGLLGVVLGAAVEAPARAESLGRLRALGLPDRDLRRVLAGELLGPVVVAGAVGLVLGAVAARLAFGSLALERITGQSGSPALVLPWWTALAVVALVVAVGAVGAVEWRRLRRRPLAELLRS